MIVFRKRGVKPHTLSGLDRGFRNGNQRAIGSGSGSDNKGSR